MPEGSSSEALGNETRTEQSEKTFDWISFLLDYSVRTTNWLRMWNDRSCRLSTAIKVIGVIATHLCNANTIQTASHYATKARPLLI